MLFDIKGKVAVVTGASRGIGKSVALGYASQGAHVVLVSRTVSEELALEVREKGVDCHIFPFDLAECHKIPQLVEEILKKCGRIDILFNNAGIQIRHCCVDFPLEDWDLVNDVNSKSVFLMCRDVGRHMLERGYGKIVNIASVLSFQGGINVPAYAASKGAVMQFTKSLANEWARHGITINCIAPGYMDTDINTAIISDPARHRQILERIPAGRWGKPEDIVGAAIFLSSSASDFVNGVILPVDGGWLSR